MDISLSLPNFPSNQLHGDISAGLGLLKSKGDDASLFFAGISEPVGPTNLLTWSDDLVSGNALIAGSATRTATTATFTSSSSDTVYRVSSVTPGSTNTFAVIISGDVGKQVKLRVEDAGSPYNGSEIVITLTNTPTLYTVSYKSTLSIVNDILRSVGQPCTVNVHRLGFFSGEYTIADILSTGGIPLTLSSPSATSYKSFISGTSLNPTGVFQVTGNERFVNPVVATNTWEDQGNGVYYCKSNVWGNLGLSVASSSVPTLIGPKQSFRVRVTISGVFTSMYLWSAIDSSGGNNAQIYSFTTPGVYDVVVTTSNYGGLWFDSNVGSGATLSNISFQQIIKQPSQLWFNAYLDSAASTVTAIDSPVGFLSDGEGTVGTSVPITNGALTANATGWTQVNSPGLTFGPQGVTITKTSASDAQLLQAIPTVVGNWYLVTGFISNATNNYIFGADSGNTGYQAVNGWVQAVFKASATTSYVTLQQGGSMGASSTFGQVSVQNLTGRHATQSTGANKPTLRRGVVNQLLYSSFPGATGVGITPNYWNGTGTQGTAPCSVLAHGALAGSQAVAVRSVSVSGLQGLQRNVSDGMMGGVPYTVGAYIRTPSGLTASGVRLYTGNSGQNQFDILSAAQQQAFVPDSWVLCSVVVTLPANAAIVSFVNPSAPVGTGFDISCPFVIAGSYTTEQIKNLGVPVTFATPVSSKNGNYSLDFNGSSSALFGNVSTTTSGLMLAGFTPRSSKWQAVMGTGGQVTVTPGVSIGMNNLNAPSLLLGSSTSANWRLTSPTSLPVGAPVVLAAYWEPNLQKLRVNGAEVAAGVSVENPTSNGSSFAIGRISNNEADMFDGLFNVGIVVRGRLTESEIRVLERFVAAFTGPIHRGLKL